MTIRPATLNDCETIAALVRSAWAGKVAPNSSGHFFTSERAQTELSSGYGWLALENEKAIGTVLLVRHPKPQLNPGVWEVKKLGVLPEYRKSGIAHLLLDSLLKKADQLLAKEIRLAVRSDQPRLVEWYQQFGFVVDPTLEYSAANPNTPPPFVMVKYLEVLS